MYLKSGYISKKEMALDIGQATSNVRTEGTALYTVWLH